VPVAGALFGVPVNWAQQRVNIDERPPIGISFRNCYIFLTSNIGSDQATARQRAQRRATIRRWWTSRWGGRDAASRRARSLTIQSVETFFDPEFYNRIDETVVFDAFDADTAELVTRKEIDGLFRKLKRRNVPLEVDTGVVHLLQRSGFDPVYGARGLRRAIRNALTEPVAHYVIRQSASEGPLRVLATLDRDAVLCTALPDH
jgi:ATP-dependent Clp protease ATP-binding subunit ClpA